MYSENLKQRIGDTDFNDLRLRAEDYKRNGRKWSREELRELIAEYKLKIKQYEASKH